MNRYPNSAARALARVLFPQEEYPSMAMMILDGGMAGINKITGRRPIPLSVILYTLSVQKSIFVFVEQKVVFSGVIGPDVFESFIQLPFIFHFLKIFNDFEGCPRSEGVIYEFIAAGRPGGILQILGEF
jgi:hypothetical protein